MWEFGVNKALMVFSGNTVLPPETDIFILGLWLQFWFVHKKLYFIGVTVDFQQWHFCKWIDFLPFSCVHAYNYYFKIDIFILYLCKCSAYVLSNTVLVLPHNHVS